MEKQKLTDFLQQQENLTKDLQSFIKTLDVDSLIEEKQTLQQHVDTLTQNLTQVKTKLQQTEREKQEYQLSFHELLVDEKVGRLRNNQKRLNELLQLNENNQYKTVDQLEATIRNDISKLNQTIKVNNLTLAEDAKQKIDNLINKLLLQVENQKALIKEQSASMTTENNAWHQEQENLKLVDGLIETETQRIKTETKVGLKAFNYLGILFIFLAVVTLGILGVNYLTDTLKGILIFLIPTLFFVAGEVLRRKDKQTFAFGLIGGSIGLYYIAIYINYFILGIFDNSIAFIMLVVISLLSIILARWYKNLAIAILALIGGYLPVISYWYLIGFSEITLYFAQSYILMLNIFMLYLYNKFNWKSLYLLSFGLMTPWMFAFADLGLHSSWMDYGYGFLYMLIYAGSTMFTLVKKESKIDVVQQVVFVGSLFIFSLFGVSLINIRAMSALEGFFVLLIHLVTYAIAIYTLKKQQAQIQGNLAYIISLALFVIYMFIISVYYVPVVWVDNYRLAYISLTTLVVGYLALGQKLQKLEVFVAGAVHYAILFIYLFYGNMFITEFPYWINAFVTIALVGQYIYLRLEKKQLPNYFKIFFNVLVFILFIYLNSFLILTIEELDVFVTYTAGYVLGSKIIGLLALIALVKFVYFAGKLPEVKKFYLAHIETVLLGFVLLSFNLDKINTINITETLLVLIANIGYVFVILSLIKDALAKQKITLSIAVLILSGIILVNGTILAYSNLEFSYLNVVEDVVYGAVAVFYIILGLKKSLPLIRQVGLGLMLIVMAKLLLFDIPIVTLLSRMLAFFAFGVLSLAISYIYQNALNKSKKLLEKKDDDSISK